MATSIFPDFRNTALFPSFLSLPIDASSSEDVNIPRIEDASFRSSEKSYLLATIHQNMTLTPRTPTFICKDRDGVMFALTIRLPAEHSDVDVKVAGAGMSGVKSKERIEGGGGGNGKEEEFDVRKYKKGWSVVVQGAERRGVVSAEETVGGKGKQGFVVREVGFVKIIPTSLEGLGEMRGRLEGKYADLEEGETVRSREKSCQGCGKTEKDDEDEGSMGRCTGCEAVWYCGKECQVKGWNERGHKKDCKVLKAVKEIFGDT